jgi:hypothetical protein
MADDGHSGGLFVVARLRAALTRANADEGLASIGVYSPPIPSHDVNGVAVNPPYYSIALTPLPDVSFTGDRRAMTPQEWTVKVIGKGQSRVPLLPYYRLIDEALQGVSGYEVSDGSTVLRSWRELPVDYPTTEGGVVYRHMGGVYRVLLM